MKIEQKLYDNKTLDTCWQNEKKRLKVNIVDKIITKYMQYLKKEENQLLLYNVN